MAVLLQPLAHPSILLLAALVMRLMRKRQAMRIFIWLAVLLPLSYGVLPVSTWPLRGLENSYPVPVIDQPVDGIIVLGGHTGSGEVSASRNQAQQNGAADRLTKGLMLHRQHPGSMLVFSGFSGQLKPKGWNEAEITRRLLAELGIEKRGIRVLEIPQVIVQFTVKIKTPNILSFNGQTSDRIGRGQTVVEFDQLGIGYVFYIAGSSTDIQKYRFSFINNLVGQRRRRDLTLASL